MQPAANCSCCLLVSSVSVKISATQNGPHNVNVDMSSHSVDELSFECLQMKFLHAAHLMNHL